MFGKEGQCSYALACCPTLQGSRLCYLNGSHAILVVTRERSFDSYILNLITFTTLLWYKGCGCSHAILTFNAVRHRARGKASTSQEKPKSSGSWDQHPDQHAFATRRSCNFISILPDRHAVSGNAA